MLIFIVRYKYNIFIIEEVPYHTPYNMKGTQIEFL